MIGKGISRLRYLYRVLRHVLSECERSDSNDELFRDVYRNNRWGGKDSVSGTGSDLIQTQVIAKEIPALLLELRVKTILDIPCGDFFWMRHVNLGDVNYLGADIVREIVQRNRKKHGQQNLSFRRLDLLKDKLPRVDLVLCRDCLVHFSFKDIFRALANIGRSESTYLLTTTFPSRNVNCNIATGSWRVLNFEVPPFHFPAPLKVINEQCTEENGIYSDKALALWRITDIRQTINNGIDRKHVERRHIDRGADGCSSCAADPA
jgi:hypothetical protein